MRSTDRTRPEIKIARRLISRHKLTVPVDILKIAEIYSTVELKEIPIDIDGVCLDLNVPGKRPTIIINKRKGNLQRRRFTMAHELGHVLIPWHTGVIVDQDDSDDWIVNSFLEAEANRFASELLMPSEWVTKEVIDFINPFDAVQHISVKADVSLAAAHLKMFDTMPSGYIFSELDSSGQIVKSQRTKGTFAAEPPIGIRVDIESCYENSTIYSNKTNGRTLVWWRLGTAPHFAATSQSSKELLKDIINDIFHEDDRKAISSSIQGIMASANSSITGERTQNSIYTAILHRMSGHAVANPKIKYFIEHSKYKSFVAAKTTEFLSKRK